MSRNQFGFNDLRAYRDVVIIYLQEQTIDIPIWKPYSDWIGNFLNLNRLSVSELRFVVKELRQKQTGEG